MNNGEIKKELPKEACGELERQLAAVRYGIEEMTSTVDSMKLFWEAEEAEVLKEAFLNFKDEVQKLLATLEKFGSTDEEKEFLAKYTAADKEDLSADLIS